MENRFTSDRVPLGQILNEAASGKLQLPDFQRGWVWDDDHIASLLASISLSYPIGAVMTLETGNPDVLGGEDPQTNSFDATGNTLKMNKPGRIQTASSSAVITAVPTSVIIDGL